MTQPINGERQIQDESISKEKLNLVSPVLGKDPVTKDYLESLDYEGQIIDLGNRIDEGLSLLDNLTAITYPDASPTWENVLSSATGTNGAGATTSTISKTISILAGNSGLGASLSQYINIAQFSHYEVGDEVIIRLLVLESTFGVLENFEVAMKSDGNDVIINPTAVMYGDNSLLFEVKFPYLITSKTETLEVIERVKSSATNLPSNGVLTWNSIGIFNTKDRYKDDVRLVSKSLKNADILYTFFERSPVISQVNITNTSDNTERFQDELDKAVQTSGELYLPRNSTILFKNTVYLNGGVRISGQGSLLNPDFLTAGELFNINTADPFVVEGIQIHRLNGSSLANPIKFNSAFVNKDSIFNTVTFSNFPEALNVDYAENLGIYGCIFLSGQAGIRLGTVSPTSVKNVIIEKCRFDSVNIASIDARSANDLHIIRNTFRKAALSTVYNARPILITSVDINSVGLRITNNNFEAFREYAIRLGITGTGTIEDTVISNNLFRDGSTVVHDGMIYATADAANSYKALTIENNIMYNKRNAIDITNAQYLNINNNTIIKDAIGDVNARAFRIVTCSDPKNLTSLKSLDQAVDIII